MSQLKPFYLITFVVLFFFLEREVFAQNNDPLEKKASISVQKEPLEGVLVSITKQTGVRFSYNSRLIDPKTMVSIQAQNKTIKEILTNILPATISYKKVGVYVVLYQIKDNSISDIRQTKIEQPNNSISDIRQTKIEQPNNPISDIRQTKIEQSNNRKSEIGQSEIEKPNNRKSEIGKSEIKKNLSSDNGKMNDSCHSDISPKNIDNTQTDNEKMIHYIPESTQTDTTATQFAFANDTQNVEFQSENVDLLEENTSKKSKPIQVSLVYPIGTDWGETAENSYYVSINVLGGITGQTKGIELGGVYNINKYSGNAQVAGIFNRTQKGKSLQFANIFNVGDTSHVQASGIWNFANQSNCQIGGIVNITKKGRFQMGLVNVRDTADGVSLGLINIVKQGGVMEAGIEADEFVHTSITLRTGVKRLYTIISVGYNYTDYFWSVASGFGTSIKLLRNLNINFELTHETLNNTVFGQYSLTQFSPVLNYRFAKNFKIYLGPSLNLHVQNEHFKYSEARRFVNIPYNFFNQTFNYLWVGVVREIK